MNEEEMRELISHIGETISMDLLMELLHNYMRSHLYKTLKVEEKFDHREEMFKQTYTFVPFEDPELYDISKYLKKLKGGELRDGYGDKA